ncbi:MAG: PSD1 and planctomycete cytochrome C domain-containing protein [Planctomycetota bacterium]
MDKRRLRVACFAIAFLGGSAQAARGEDLPTATAEKHDFFERQIRPLLAEHCYSCHSNQAKELKAGLLVDSRKSLLVGGDSGEAVVPGDPDGSLLIEAVRYESYEMPPKGKLSEREISALVRWIEMGAPWPAEAAATGNAATEAFDLQKRRAEHWVWQQIRAPSLPDVQDSRWPISEIDHFILDRLKESDLEPAPSADRRALVRRMYFDLIGLPPTAEQVAKFLSDKAPHAIDRVVDELLASKHFGERWGRHWLDLVRYAESRGHEFDNDAPNAYQYRDYVIRALNADVPYDQLVREHIAGDLIEPPRLHPEYGFNESVLGTGFWFLGEWVHSPVDIRKEEADRFDNMIDVMSKAFLGVTVGCARCHDHKFDAISTADYYSLSGFLQSSDYRQLRFESLESNRQVARKLSQVDSKYRQAITSELKQLSFDLPVSPSDGDQRNAVVDYSSIAPEEYLQDGFIFGDAPRRSGQLCLANSADGWKVEFAERTAAASDAFWHGLVSSSEQGQKNQSALAKLPRSGRTLRTPTFSLTTGSVMCRVRGEGHVVACVDSHRMIAGPLHRETIVPVRANQAWVEMKLQRYVGHRLHLEFTPAQDSQLEVCFVIEGATQDELDQLARREQANAEAIQRCNQSLEQLQQDGASEVDRLKVLVNAWAVERAALQDQVTVESQLAMAMLDGAGEDGRVLIRGNSSRPGDVEPRHFLTAVSGEEPMEIATGSGRLQLADAINHPANPLTTRVIVNRIWHHMMGRGIVPTTDDFGVLGQRPTHLELLDYLATKFVEDGFSIKAMIRRIVLSRTYQMSSRADPAALKQDPKNLNWHHRPPRRLEGEAIRDAMLAVSGSLNATQFGEPVPVHLTAFMDGRGKPGRNGPLDGDNRRSIYLAVRRNFLSPFMLTFDTPAPFSTMGRRNVSNVPAQALILMNDPLVVELAKRWAEISINRHADAEQRIGGMYEAAFARQPTKVELAAALQYVEHASSHTDDSEKHLQFWTDFAHALINTKEFIFLR